MSNWEWMRDNSSCYLDLYEWELAITPVNEARRGPYTVELTHAVNGIDVCCRTTPRKQYATITEARDAALRLLSSARCKRKKASEGEVAPSG